MLVLASIVLNLSIESVHGTDSSKSELECSRLPSTYCCTTRVRVMCEAQCSAIHCDADFYRRERKIKELVVAPQTTYRNGLNDGDTGDVRAGIQMIVVNRKPLPEKLPKRRYLPPPTSSDENESLIVMSNSEDNKETGDVIPLLSTTISSSNSELKPPETTLKPQSLFTTVQEGSQRKHWEIRSFNITYHPNWLQKHNFINSNSNFTELKKAECGKAPNFSSCISILQANIQFGQCCSNKMLPTNCQHSCKYNVKENEISKIIGAGFCAVLHIIPIIQCASNGQDNSECCRYKQIAIKSAPQCEIFCRSGQELTKVGLEHLVCRKVMDEIIACHLSGLKN